MKLKRRTLSLIIKWVIRITIVSSVAVTFYLYFFTSLFTITSYQISGVDTITAAEVETQLRNLDTQKIFNIVPRNKIFTYSNTLKVNTIQNSIPEVASVSIRPVGLHTLKIEVTQLKPLFRVSDTQGITADGIIFSTKNDLRVYPRITIASSTEKKVKIYDIVFTQVVFPNTTSKDFLIELSSLSGKISSIIFPVESIVVESTGDISCFNKDGTSKVIFLKDSDYKKTWSTLVSAIDTNPLKNKLLTSREKLEYLDVRYGNKVFYRFRDMSFQNGTVNGILGSHATTTQGGFSSSSIISQ